VDTELKTRGEELFEGEVGGPFVVDAGGVEEGPRLAEVVVLAIKSPSVIDPLKESREHFNK
jgi:hypothetical protein